MDLLLTATEAFAEIEKKTGEKLPHATVNEAFESFQNITETRGLTWLIDAASVIGMSHLGWTYWMTAARNHLWNTATNGE